VKADVKNLELILIVYIFFKFQKPAFIWVCVMLVTNTSCDRCLGQSSF